MKRLMTAEKLGYEIDVGVSGDDVARNSEAVVKPHSICPEKISR